MVTPGQEVKAGEPLAIVEAMKMENVLRAERDGTMTREAGQRRAMAARSMLEP
jgi:propionyl-CoA carboxylase alpha chain